MKEFFSVATPFVGRKKYQLIALSLILPLGYLVFGYQGLSASLVVATVLTLVINCLVVESEVHQGVFEKFVPGSLLGILYPGLLLTHLVVSTQVIPGQILMWMVLVVVATDSFAYFGGMYFRTIIQEPTLLAPRLSPKKTVIGLACGLIGAIVVGVLLAPIFFSAANVAIPSKYICALSALFIAISAVFGDLSESLVKRVYNVKDMGTILPGHGGILDRVDALLFANVALLCIFKCLS